MTARREVIKLPDGKFRVRVNGRQIVQDVDTASEAVRIAQNA